LGFLRNIIGKKEVKEELFPQLSLEEKRRLLNLSESSLQMVLSSREAQFTLVDAGMNIKFLEKMSDDEIMAAMELIRLCQKATNAADPRESIRIYEKIIAKAPFDSISMLSIGVCYANLGDGRKAVSYVERALRSDPDNQRIRQNLEGIRQHFGL